MKTVRSAVDAILKKYSPKQVSYYSAFAPANIALCKYWGKRDAALNLPMNDSVSVTMGDKGTQTAVTVQGDHDQIIFNDHILPSHSSFYQRMMAHINLFRQHFKDRSVFLVKTYNNFATCAGLASSASGFAALTKAMAGIYGVPLSDQEMSVLARLGSGSACRSIMPGFMHWKKGEQSDGQDSYACSIACTWKTFCIGILVVSEESKAVNSRKGMEQTMARSTLYAQWPEQAECDVQGMKQAIAARHFAQLGQIAECNALMMHATVLAMRPPMFYWWPETLMIVRTVWQLREQKKWPIYCTIDAGPNVILLFETPIASLLRDFFPKMEIIYPFSSENIGDQNDLVK